jgi:hypothetical protein
VDATELTTGGRFRYRNADHEAFVGARGVP